MIKYLENENFDDEVKEGIVLVDFFANWCGPCKMLGTVIEEVVEELNIKVLKVDTDKHEDLAMKYRIMSIPYLVLFKDGKDLKHNVGFLTKDDLIKFVKED